MKIPADKSVHYGKTYGFTPRGASDIDPLAIDGIDHVEIYSPNAKETVYFLSRAMGFVPVAYRGPETGYPDAASYLLRQGTIAFLVTTPIRVFNPINQLLFVHGTTVRDIALQVPDCEAFYNEALARGAKSVMPPTVWRDEFGEVRKASIATYGDVIHSIVDRKDYKGEFWPGFIPYGEIFPEKHISSTGIFYIDHIVGNVELGGMERWVKFYEDVLGFKEMLHFSDKQISTEYSALMSKVMRDGQGKVRFPINEPAEGRRKSQIQEYLDFHCGPGVQHIALLTTDIIDTVTKMQEQGMDFLKVPRTYYEELEARVGKIDQDISKIADLGILVDRDDDGYLLQIFTRPMTDRPTLFFEIIQREGSAGFGVGNFKALFEAIERDQALRGNL